MLHINFFFLPSFHYFFILIKNQKINTSHLKKNYLQSTIYYYYSRKTKRLDWRVDTLRSVAEVDGVVEIVDVGEVVVAVLLNFTCNTFDQRRRTTKRTSITCFNKIYIVMGRFRIIRAQL